MHINNLINNVTYYYGDVIKASESIIKPEQIRTIEVDAVADTGATYVCLSRKDIEDLGLPFH